MDSIMEWLNSPVSDMDVWVLILLLFFTAGSSRT